MWIISHIYMFIVIHVKPYCFDRLYLFSDFYHNLSIKSCYIEIMWWWSDSPWTSFVFICPTFPKVGLFFPWNKCALTKFSYLIKTVVKCQHNLKAKRILIFSFSLKIYDKAEYFKKCVFWIILECLRTNMEHY